MRCHESPLRHFPARRERPHRDKCRARRGARRRHQGGRQGGPAQPGCGTDAGTEAERRCGRARRARGRGGRRVARAPALALSGNRLTLSRGPTHCSPTHRPTDLLDRLPIHQLIDPLCVCLVISPIRRRELGLIRHMLVNHSPPLLNFGRLLTTCWRMLSNNGETGSDQNWSKSVKSGTYRAKFGQAQLKVVKN